MVNQDDSGVGLCLRLHLSLQNELACSFINQEGSDRCCLCVAAREYAAGDNNRHLDVATVKIMKGFTEDHVNSTTMVMHMQLLFPIAAEC